MSFNDLITQHINGDFPIIEDVIVYRASDATCANVTICGAYGKPLADQDISDAELDALTEDLMDCNFYFTE